MIHVSQIASTFVKDIRDHVKEGDIVKAKIIQIDENGRISLSIKKAADPAPRTGSFSRPAFNGVPDKLEWGRDKSGLSFEEMMSKYKQDSEEKIADWKRGCPIKRFGKS
jgi:S1 RNA binding domain protein